MELSTAPEAHFKELFAQEYEKLCRYAYSYMQDEPTNVYTNIKNGYDIFSIVSYSYKDVK